MLSMTEQKEEGNDTFGSHIVPVERGNDACLLSKERGLYYIYPSEGINMDFMNKFLELWLEFCVTKVLKVSECNLARGTYSIPQSL